MSVAKASKSEVYESKVMKGDVCDFAEQMTHMLNNREHSDIKFLLGPNRKTVYAHRCILSARCPVFHAMFSEQTQKNGGGDKDVPLVMSDMSADIFTCILEFIYTNCVTLNQKTAVDVLATSIEYGLDQLKKLCINYLCESVSAANVCDVMQASVIYRQEQLSASALRYIENNTKSVFKSKRFHELSEEALISILKSNDLQIDELDILAAVKEWTTVNAVIKGKPLGEVAKNVINYIRFHLLTTDELATVEEQNVKDKLISLGAISSAWRFHALKRLDSPESPLLSTRTGTKPRDCHKFLQKS